ncbi:hypothetical protein ACFVYP_36010 [Kitasatospora sp. NPDC058201]|uniref:hypothetical protein n=1 Tax=unclassified Kitasatospora TaxID=2633591 RepID=UPI00366813C3
MAGSSGTLLACIGFASLAAAQATTGTATPGTASADPAMPAVVEDFLHPGAERLLTERKITLKQGDGRIRLKEGPDLSVPTSCQASNEIFVESRLDKYGYCFLVTGTSGYLAMELPDVYGIWTEDRAVSARLVAAGQEKQVNIGPNSVEPVGESLPGGKRSVLVELRVTG